MLGVWLAAGTAAAMEVRSGDVVVVAEDEVIRDDLYAAGRVVRIEGTVQGDAIVAARSVEIAGEVRNDLLAAGQQVRISGEVGDDARLAGAEVLLPTGARVGHDLVVVAGELALAQGARIRNDLAFAGGQASLEGAIARHVRASAAALEVDGEVGGDVDALLAASAGDWGWRGDAEPVPPGLSVGPGAVIGGAVTYEAPEPGRIDPAARIAEPVAYTISGETRPSTAWVLARRFLALVVVGGIALLVAPRFVDAAADRVSHQLLRSLGWGLVAVLVWVAAAATIALMVLTAAWLLGVVGLSPLSALVMAAGALAEVGWVLAMVFALGWLAQAAVALAVGERLVRPRGVALVLGLLIFVLLRAIPVVGSVLGILVGLVGLGAIVATLARPRAERRADLDVAHPVG